MEGIGHSNTDNSAKDAGQDWYLPPPPPPGSQRANQAGSRPLYRGTDRRPLSELSKEEQESLLKQFPEIDSIELSEFDHAAIEQSVKEKIMTFDRLEKELDESDKVANSFRMPQNVWGLTLPVWRRIIGASALCYSRRKKLDPATLLKFEPSLHERTVYEIFETPEFRDALRARGVTASWIGLTEKQMLALSVVTDMSDRRSLAAKLRSVGTKGWEWEQWLSDPKFKKLVRELGEELLDSHIPTVNMALIQRAESGDLGSIKYFNEVSGRYDPNSKAVLNTREFLMGVVDILNDTIDDPELLRRIGGRLATLAGGTGVMSSQEITNETNSAAELETDLNL